MNTIANGKGRFMRNLSVATATKNLLTLVTSIALIGTGIAGCGKTEDAQKLMSDARQYQQKGDDKAAIIQLKNVLQKNPDDAEARYLLGTIYNKTGDLQSAEKELRRALSLGTLFWTIGQPVAVKMRTMTCAWVWRYNS